MLPPEPIAIIGLGCRFPGARTPDKFWQNLCTGVDCIGEIPPDRWNIQSFFDAARAQPGRSDSKWAGLVENIEEFDAAFFGISPREAMSIDPQHRWLLETAWQALEDAGQPLDLARGTNTGVFVGLSTNDYAALQGNVDLTDVDLHFVTGCAASIAANRISYCLNLRGPSLTVDTACSSSLVAVHLACQALQRGECTTALAAGVNVIVSPLPFIAFSSAGMLSPEGRCKTFDAAANGFVRGEGAGAVVLKPLAQAVAAGDTIYAVICGTGVNQDGRTPGMMVPDGKSQEQLMRDVCRHAGVSPQQIRYVEAHGTGTAVGDPIEANALGRALDPDGTRREDCFIGSVKTNIGHLEAAAGIAGLIKVALALQHREIPPSLHFRQPNPQIDFARLKIRVPNKCIPLPPGREPVFAAVNSFGWGGTNAHAILRTAPPRPAAATAPASSRPWLLPLSARSTAALSVAAKSYLELLQRAEDGATPLGDLCRSAALRRTHFEHRLTAIGRTHGELREQLLSAASAEPAALGRKPLVGNRSITFVFCGQGPQWWAMGRELLRDEPVFRTALAECAELVQQTAGWSLWDELTISESGSRVGDTVVAQPLLVSLQIALVALWRSWGISPGAVVGHSAGEIAAAHIAGALSLADALRVVCRRAEAMGRIAAGGRMLAAGLAEPAAREVVGRFPGRVFLAAVNSPQSVTFSGDVAALETVALELKSRHVFTAFVPGNHAFHSAHMDPVEKELRAALLAISPQTPNLPIASTVTGALANEILFDAAYWWANVRQPVQFAPAISQLAAGGRNVFLEVGPHPVLAASLRECLGPEARVLASLQRGADERTTMLTALAELYRDGHTVNWPALYPSGGGWVRLPPLPLRPERYWKEPVRSREVRLSAPPHPFLQRRVPSADPCWEVKLDARLFPYLTDHRVNGLVVFPAAGFLEMALGAAREIFGPGTYELEGVDILQALFLPEDAGSTMLQLTYAAEDSSFIIRSRPELPAAVWATHVTGKMRPGSVAPRSPVPLAAARRRCRHQGTGAELYKLSHGSGLQYGSNFQGITAFWRRDLEIVAQARLPAGVAPHAPDFLIHPAYLDTCFQPGFAALPAGAFDSDTGTLLPVHIDLLRYNAPPAPTAWVHGVIRHLDSSRCIGDIRLTDARGKVYVETVGFRQVFLRGGTANQNDSIYELAWHPQPGPGPAMPATLPRLAFNDLIRSGRRPVITGDDKRRWAQAQRALNALAAAYLLQACQTLGSDARHPKWRTDAAMKRMQIAPRIAPQVRRLLEQLGSVAQRRRALALDTAAAWRRLLARMPSCVAELTLLERCGRQLTGILRGTVRAADCLFPGGADSAWDQLQSDSPLFAGGNGALRDFVVQMVPRLPAGRKLRILELGGGTGALTAHLLPYLSTQRTEYLFTDPSSDRLAEFQRKFPHQTAVRCQVLDLHREPEAQGFAPGSFDLIIAGGSLPSPAEISRGLPRLRSLLATDGILVFPLAGRMPFWFELLFAPDRDPAGSRPAADWPRALTQAKFATIGLAAPLLWARAPSAAPLPAAAQPAAPARPRHWLILGDPTGVADKLAQLLQQRGDTSSVVSFGSGTTKRADLQRIWAGFSSAPGHRGVVHLWSLGASPGSALSAATLNAAQDRGTFSLLHLVQAIGASVQGDEETPLFVVTRGAQPVKRTDGPVNLESSPLIGLARVIRTEHPRLHCRLCDLDPGQPEDEVSALADELQLADREQEVAWRENLRYVQRLERSGLSSVHAERDVVADDPRKAYRLTIAKPGVMEQLALRRAPWPRLGANEVRIEIVAAGLNFRDVMKALGIYPTEADDGQVFGDECAGRIVARGENVRRWRVGDEVMALAAGCLATHVVTDQRLVLPKPRGLGFEEAATMLIAYLTSHYALHTLGRIRRGERVLIHAAAGGVGFAAIQLAQRCGAEIFATAGSPAKRDFLRACGVRHVLDSRSLAFADEIRRLTDGRGVDLVLNSLAGDAIAKSLSLLGPSGRFLEIGRNDIYRNTKLGLRPFANNLSYFAVDLSRLMQPGQFPLLAAPVLAALTAGTLRPLPYRRFPLAGAAGAFRYMSQALQVGKIVLTPGAAPLVVAPPATGPGVRFRPHATYLITGGLGGFGGLVAKSMVMNGARHLVLMGRHGNRSPGARELLAALRHEGARVLVVRGDVSRERDVRRLLTRIDRQLPPLRGIVHAAGLIDDGTLLHLDAGRFHRVMAPKVGGAWHLHHLTLGRRLDFFVLFSSAAAVLGLPGQGNYAAANSFLDALAHHRRALGLPALAVNWGILGDVGMVARSPKLQEHFARLGWASLPSHEAVRLLAQSMRAATAQVTIARINWSTVADRIIDEPRYEQLARAAARSAPERPDDATWIRATLATVPPAAGRKLLEDYLSTEIARTLQAKPAQLGVDRPLTELGLDSLMLVEFVTRVDRQLGTAVPTGRLMGSSTIARLAEVLLDVLAPSAPAAPVAPRAPAPAPVAWTDEIVLDPAIRFDTPVTPVDRATRPAAVFLTSATDILSLFLLRDLLQTTQADIYCLEGKRNGTSLRRHIQQEFTRYGLTGDLSRIHPVTGSLGEPLLGQSAARFAGLAAKTDAIFHTGATINHLAPYDRLKAANVSTINAVLRLATEKRRKPVHYVSSISILSAGMVNGTTRVAESSPLTRVDRLVGGYAQSRWAAEKILELGRARGVDVNVYRPGLLVADSNGRYAPPEHFMWSMLKLCLQLGCGPDLENHTWLTPIDYVSRSIVTLALDPKARGTFHLVNSDGGGLRHLLAAAKTFGYDVTLVSPDEWETRLAALADGLSANPLLPYMVLAPREVQSMFYDFRQLPLIDCRVTEQVLRGHGILCPIVGEAQLHQYLKAFVRTGFLHATPEQASRQPIARKDPVTRYQLARKNPN